MSEFKGGNAYEAPLTREEKSAIAALKRLQCAWPASLWLFASGDTINVMRCNENGERVYGDTRGATGDMRDYWVDRIDIPNDGCEW